MDANQTESAQPEKELQANQEDNTAPPLKKAKVEPDNSTGDTSDKMNSSSQYDCSTCVVCMETGTEEVPLLSHECKQCKADAWKICLCCHEALLSRTCPVCRGDYAPMVMHVIPGMPLRKLADKSITAEEKTELLYKFGVIRELVKRSNVAVYSAVSQRMNFSLPQRLADDSEDTSFVIVSIPIAKEEVQGLTFDFTNKIWDEIENQVELGAVQAGEVVRYSQALNWILNYTKEDDNKLYSMMSPSDWQYMLDPSDSPETTEALRAIRESIVKNALAD